MAARARKRAKAGYMISAVAELYRLHPQHASAESHPRAQVTQPHATSYPQIKYLPQTRALAPAAPDAYSLCMAQVECPRCRGTGFRPHTMRLYGVEARVAVPCDCVEGERTARALERASIPKRYEHCDFENFDTGLYESEPQAAAWNRRDRKSVV